jgi:hypothetical protein
MDNDNLENDLSKFGHHHKPELHSVSNDENELISDVSPSKKARVAGWLLISAATIGSGLSAWTVVESFQDNNNFFEPTPAKLAVSSVLAGVTLVGTIFSRRTE